MTLRHYQLEAKRAAIEWLRQSIDPCCLDMATGAGKSHVIAAIAQEIHAISKGKHVLCLAPSKELVEQNAKKYRLTGNACSICSASAGEVCLAHPVVFGTPVSVLNRIEQVSDKFCLIVIDECHRISPVFFNIIERMKQNNPKLRIVGLSATPYRMNTGYIYEMDPEGKVEEQAIDPFFKKCVYRVGADYLIELGYLTPPLIGKDNDEYYETIGMELDKKGQFLKTDIERVFQGKGRKTAKIVADIIGHSQDRNGVLIFAATIAHAKEVMDSLPPELSRIVTGTTPQNERAQILADFDCGRFKYLVNVAVLTTGYDAPHIDLIALLRATESVSLLQQIIGRGLRLNDNKTDCLILDYAQNIERHCPDGDVFRPVVKVIRAGEGDGLRAICPDCGYQNEFTARKNEDGFQVDENGYFIGPLGRITTIYGEMPAHYGRRCVNQIKRGWNYERCNYRWTFKVCEKCEAENDIAARYCSSCKTEIVDPNEKLRLDFARYKKDPKKQQTDIVLSWEYERYMSSKGNLTLKVHYKTEYRKVLAYYMIEKDWSGDYRRLLSETNGLKTMPKTITYKKKGDFYKIIGYNKPHDTAENTV